MTSIKQKIIGVVKLLHNNKFNSIYDGNISFREAGSPFFYITQGGFKKYKINKSNILKFDNNTDFLIKENNYYKGNKVSREVFFHQSILNSNPINEDIAIIHCHPKNIISYMKLESEKRELKTIHNYFPEIDLQIGNNVPKITAGTTELANQVAHNIENNDIIGLENHGIVSIADNLEDAYDNMYNIEYHCEIFNIQK